MSGMSRMTEACPSCGSEVDYDVPRLVDDFVVHPVYCTSWECKWVGKEWYSTQFERLEK